MTVCTLPCSSCNTHVLGGVNQRSLGAAGDGGVVCSQQCQPKQCINSWVDHSSCDHLVLKGLDDLVADHAANFVLLHVSGVCVCCLSRYLNDNGLTGSIPSELGNLAQLEDL